jgi:hypothetical protein
MGDKHDTATRQFLLPLATCLVSLVLSGCGFASFTRLSVNDPIKPEDVTFITPGKTTLAEVIAKLGTPDEVIGLDDAGAVVSYHFLDAKYARINYGWPLQFVSPVSVDMILAGGGLATDVFQVAFDSQWVARQQAFAKHVQASQYRLWPFKDD